MTIGDSFTGRGNGMPTSFRLISFHTLGLGKGISYPAVLTSEKLGVLLEDRRERMAVE